MLLFNYYCPKAVISFWNLRISFLWGFGVLGFWGFGAPKLDVFEDFKRASVGAREGAADVAKNGFVELTVPSSPSATITSVRLK